MKCDLLLVLYCVLVVLFCFLKEVFVSYRKGIGNSVEHPVSWLDGFQI